LLIPESGAGLLGVQADRLLGKGAASSERFPAG